MRVRTITVNWLKPIMYRKAYYNDKILGIGVYYISRKFGGKESVLYIGKTYDCFYNRIISHDQS